MAPFPRQDFFRRSLQFIFEYLACFLFYFRVEPLKFIFKKNQSFFLLNFQLTSLISLLSSFITACLSDALIWSSFIVSYRSESFTSLSIAEPVWKDGEWLTSEKCLFSIVNSFKFIFNLIARILAFGRRECQIRESRSMQSGASAKENMYDNYAELQGALKLMSSRSNHRYLSTSETFGQNFFLNSVY